MSKDAKTENQGTSLLDEVVEIASRMTADKTRLEQICRLIAAGSPDPAAEPAAGEDPAPRRRGRRAVAKGRRKPKGTTEPEEKVTYHPGQLVECAFCGAQVGTRRVGVVNYPYRHDNDVTGKTCPGCKQPAKTIAE